MMRKHLLRQRDIFFDALGKGYRKKPGIESGKKTDTKIFAVVPYFQLTGRESCPADCDSGIFRIAADHQIQAVVWHTEGCRAGIRGTECIEMRDTEAVHDMLLISGSGVQKIGLYRNHASSLPSV
ncbi:MAG: hypothetical protein LKG77_01665 [Lachnospiraceae bacterium]|nr:hypothetical protein [Lachnospiraceae bacterium]MCI1377914.1 hypothetical protein [Lachnospiraceae bacterium]